ncbi:uncharacterized protein LOC127136386 [Lathyrus oleraceus]|uniref:uncharacterized protein LOC127136386 n=1 Tax=Pisum sativum TaxID=3888 RepID=UPI0021D3CCE8|nr:uncharacterized protein LOC127136386 [Pisum sativum]
MLEIAQRERVAEAEAGMRKNDSHIGTSGLVNQDESFTHAKKSFVHILIGNKGDGDHVEPYDASAQHVSEVGGDDPYDAFCIPDPLKPKVLPDPAAERFHTLEKKIKVIEGNNIFGSIAMNMLLVSNLVISAKFKTPDFKKYKGQPCPRSHLVMYFRKMDSHTENDKLLIHRFQDSLSGASLRWYMSLEKGRIQSWEDLADAFLHQYKYNLDMAPDRMQLQGMVMNEKESFKEYTQRWRELAAQVEPPLSEKEMTGISVDTLKDPFFDRLVSSAASDFAHLVTIGDRIKKSLRDGKIQGAVATPNAPKKYSGGFQKKKEGDINSISRGYKGKQQISYDQVADVQQPPQQRQQQNAIPQRQFKPRPPRRQLDPLPVPYSHIFLYLQKEGLLTLRELKPSTFPYPPGYDANAHCEFNMGAPGHTLENCFAFQNRVQDLIETKVITFTPRRPNVSTNAMPTHEGASVSAIEEVNKGDLIKKVEEIQTPIVVIGAQLLKSGLIPIDLVDEENVEELKSFIQQMLDQGEMQIERHNEDMKEK